MDVGPLVVLGLMWVVLNALRKGSGKPPDRSRTSPGARPPVPQRPTASFPRTVPPARPTAATSTQDPTQREGSQLEQLLGQLGRTLDQARGPAGPPDARRLPSAPGAKATGSLQRQPEAPSLEEAPARGERAVVDRDDEAERVVEQRLAAVEAGQRELTDADYQAFEHRIRQEPADKTATRKYTAKQLREAVVWREILGPPVSLRGEENGEG